MLTESLSIAAIQLDKIQQRILELLYTRSESWREPTEIARAVFPGSAAYRDSELRGYLQPRLRRMAALGIVKINRLGAAISLKGIELMERSNTRSHA